jgi:uncharacterized protein YdhG (YjbR/CyaY superfamily)
MTDALGAKSNTKPTTHDEYLATLSAEHRAVLESLRRTIQAAAPGATECISYNLPAFRLNGKILIFYGAAAAHSALYAINNAILEAHKHEVQSYDTSGKGTIRFPWNKPLPLKLVTKLVKFMVTTKAQA